MAINTRVTQLSATVLTTQLGTRITQLSVSTLTRSLASRVTQLSATVLTKLVTRRPQFTRMPPSPGITSSRHTLPPHIGL